MAVEVFTWRVQAAPAGQIGFRTLEAGFGDGYVQAAADGINNRDQAWQISMRGLRDPGCVGATDMDAVMNFLDARQGYQSFEWTTPRGDTNTFRCVTYDCIHEGNGVWSLTASFVQRWQA